LKRWSRDFGAHLRKFESFDLTQDAHELIERLIAYPSQRSAAKQFDGFSIGVCQFSDHFAEQSILIVGQLTH